MAEEYRPRAQQKELELTLDLPESYPLIESDPSRVRQVVGNLVANAVKYTPAGGRVRVRVDQVEGNGERPACGRIAVVDTGPGIPPDKHDLLFEEFSRLDPSAGEGLGIGLAISLRIARALGGDIEVESEPGCGSTFIFRVPVRPV
jgi:signal transduction histidine kinase